VIVRRRHLLPPRTGTCDAARRARKPRFLARPALHAVRLQRERPTRRS